MKKNYWKMVFRTIKESFSRFLAIFLITALGVGFLVGLLCTSPDIRTSVDGYYDAHNLFDLDIKGTMGLTEADVQAMDSRPETETVTAVYQKDVLADNPDGQNQVARLHAADYTNDVEHMVNSPELLEGRFPEKAGECVLLKTPSFSGSFSVGDTIALHPEEEDEELFANTSLEIVGIASSPLYTALENVTSSVGNGIVSLFLLVDTEELDTDLYTDIYVTVQEARALHTFGSAYDTLINAEKDSLKSFGKERAAVRDQEIRSEAEDKLADAEQEYQEKKADTEEELADARKKLDDAKKELDDGKKEIEDGEKEISDGKKELKEAKKQLDSSKKQLDSAKRKLDASAPEIKKIRETLKNKAAIEEARTQVAQYDNGMAQLEAAQVELEKGQAQLKQSEDELNRIKLDYEAAKAAGAEDEQLAAYVQAIAEGEAKLEAASEQLKSASAEIENKNAALLASSEAVEKARAQITGWDKNYDTMVSAVNSYESAKKKYEKGKKQYEKGLSSYRKGMKKIAESEEKLEEAKQTYADGLKEYEDGEAEYADGRKEANDAYAEAEEKIADARKEIDELEASEWYILKRNTNPSYVSIDGNSDKVAALAKVFPIFFFLVAALVALTTMTRMVEEERVQIGTMKALGYSKGAILLKYLLYAGAAGILGSVAGILIGQVLFPTVLWNAYSMMYSFPMVKTPFLPVYALPAAVAAVLSVLLATISACGSILRECPSRLMLPKSPKAGKRIWLEYIKPVWSRMRFTHKVTARNMFRYKKRLCMTLVGIAGCTSLLVTGFGIRDSISDIVEIQYEQLQKYGLSVSFSEDAAEKEKQEVTAYLDTLEAAYTALHMEQGKVIVGELQEDVYLDVPENAAAFTSFMTFRDRKTQETVPFDDNSVLLTEKLASTLGVQPGDTVTIENGDEKRFTVEVTGIVENYVRAFVYIGRNAYREAVGEDADFTTLAVMCDMPASEEDQVIIALHQFSCVGSATFMRSTIQSFENMLSKIDFIVIVLIICAAILAFVVLYNLTNINISERQREIATIKVLGFYAGEVDAYIFRETFLLSLLGAVCGLFVGTALHRFVVVTVEVSNIMFGRSIYPQSYLFSLVLTLLFTILVCLALRRRLKKISMVESLKSVD